MRRSIVDAVARVKRELQRQSRPAGEFDPSRYFRTTERLEFLNVRTPMVRALGRLVAREHRAEWSIDEAIEFTERLLRERALELKGAGIEALSVRRRELQPRHLAEFKRWLERNLAANWATTDALCGTVLGPLLIAHPELVKTVEKWGAHRNLWARRASAVSLVRLASRGEALDAAYRVADALRSDEHDLIHKAAGWLLREAGRSNRARLEAWLLEHGPSIPRTTVRYAIERFPPPDRARILAATRGRSTVRPVSVKRRIGDSPIGKSSDRHIAKFFR